MEDSSDNISLKHIALITETYLNDRMIQFNSAGIHLKLTIENRARFFITKIDTNNFERVLSNITNNAIEASSNQANKIIECDLSYNQTDKSLILSIKDHGHGMSKGQIQKILAGKAKTTKKKGHGIGLRLVIELIESWGAKCEISSNINHGTVFRISFPANKAQSWLTHIIYLKANSILAIINNGGNTYQKSLDLINAHGDKVTYLQQIYSQTALSKIISRPMLSGIALHYQSSAKSKPWLEVLKNLPNKSPIYIVTDWYHDKEIQALCAEYEFKLIPTPLLSFITINRLSEQQP